jgi:hypothetical protein
MKGTYGSQLSEAKTEQSWLFWFKFYEPLGQKKRFLVKKKKYRTVMRTVKKSKSKSPVTQKRVEISQKFKQIQIQQTQSNHCVQENLSKNMTHC